MQRVLYGKDPREEVKEEPLNYKDLVYYFRHNHQMIYYDNKEKYFNDLPFLTHPGYSDAEAFLQLINYKGYDKRDEPFSRLFNGGGLLIRVGDKEYFHCLGYYKETFYKEYPGFLDKSSEVLSLKIDNLEKHILALHDKIQVLSEIIDKK